MSLAPGTRLGPYEIVAPLGAGGMGEVHRARDPRLGREVAIKVLPAELADDPERLRRFEVEAKAVSALNHPHIVTLHEIGQSERGPYLVLEKVEGRSLRELLAAGALPVKRVLGLGAQIAEGLAKAHSAGIVHRDLKPENVMVSEDGFAKILDFGLARLVYPELEAGDAAQLTTLVEKTASGMIVGTLGYLSPEQAAGKPADFRSDQFALGALLYELATGERPFRRETTPETLTAILREEPEPLRARNGALPAQLGWIVERCLAKDPNDRYASTRDLARDLADLRDRLSDFGRSDLAPAARIDSRRHRERLLWIVVCAALVAALAWRFAAPGGRQLPQTIAVERLTRIPGVEQQPAISPDGKSVVYNRDRDLWLQRVGGSNPINLTADSPGLDFAAAFSPDGQLLAFNSIRGDGGGLFVMGATGESVRRLTTRGFLPAWTPDGKELVFANNANDTSYSGGTALGLEAVEVATGRIRSLCDCVADAPVVSPHGAWVAYWSIDSAGGARRDLWVVPLAGVGAGGAPRRLTDDLAHEWNPAWSPDGRWLYFVSDRGGSPNLWRLPFDPSSGRARGDAEPLTLPSGFVHSFRLAADGRTLVYAAQTGGSDLVRVAFDPRSAVVDRANETTLRLGELVWGLGSPSFSPDDQWLAVLSGAAGNDLLLLESRGRAARTLVAAGSHHNRGPAWAPDGRTIAFASDRSGRYDIWAIDVDGGSLRTILATGQMLLQPLWSPDGSRLAAAENSGGEVWRTVVHAMREPVDRFERLPDLPDGAAFSAEAWSADGSALVGLSTKSGVWSWSLGDRAYRQLLATESTFDLAVIGVLPDGSILLGQRLYPGVRIERLEPATGRTALVLEDPTGLAAALESSETGLWLNRSRQEADLWVARLDEAPR
jgi:Tol biopolymer transport system component